MRENIIYHAGLQLYSVTDDLSQIIIRVNGGTLLIIFTDIIE